MEESMRMKIGLRMPKNPLKLAILPMIAAGAATLLLGGPGAGATAGVEINERRVESPSPAGFPSKVWESLIPADNPITPEKAALGKDLFFDKRLSSDMTVSCATCHDPAAAFADNSVVGIGVQLQKGARNSPSILNAVFNEAQFWDGRASSLEEQSKQPLINPIEMGMKDHAAVVARVRDIPEYQKRFAQVFGGEGVTIDTIAKAIATFERTVVSGNSPFDRFVAGDKTAISESAKRGWELYNGKARCVSCHGFNPSLPFFSDFKFHNIGVAAKDVNFSALARRAQQAVSASAGNQQEILDRLALAEGFSELGRYLVTKEPKDIGAFKTPMLRDVELTAPYMHNGSEKTLLDVVKFYNRGGEKNPNLDGGIRPLDLTDKEMDDLVELLKTFTSDDTRKLMKESKIQTRAPYGRTR
jgi:cytochrome c peroxidase